MYAIGEFFDMLFAKCETRGQQFGVTIGMFVLVACAAGGMWFFLGLGEAAVETAREAHEQGLRLRGRDGINQAVLMGWGGVIVCGLVGLLFALVGIVNALRFFTGTGLKEPEAW